MISQLALAITTKLKLLYEEPEKGKFLSVPLGMSFSPKQLTFMKSDDKTLTQESLSLASQFSRTMNLIPSVRGAFSSDGRYLWDVYRSVLKNAVLAEVHLSDAEEQELKKARDLLYTAPGQESPALLEYYQYKTVFENAENTYNSGRIAAEAGTDSGLKTKWKDEQEPKLKQKLEEAARTWTLFGHKAEVEAALARIKMLAGRTDPSTVWNECQDALTRSELTDLEGGGAPFCYTAFNPSNIVDPGSQWIPISLTRGEVESLAAGASKEIRDVFGSSGSGEQIDLDIERFTLDVAEVYLHRPWFNPDILTTHYWKLPPGFGPLSDGKPSPEGDLPAYTVSVLLARNIKFKLVANSAKNKQALTQMQRANMNFMVGPVPIPRINPKVPVRSIRTVDHRVFAKPAGARPAGRPAHRPARVAPKAAPHAATPATAHPAASAVQLKKFETLRIKVSSGAVQLPGAKQPAGTVLPATTVSPAKDPPVSDELQVLAFISKKMPLSPSPDPSLRWLA